MTEPSITAEIHKLIDEKLANGVIVHPNFIATELLDAKGEIEGENAMFYRTMTFKQVLGLVRSASGKYDTKDTTSSQLAFPGFKHLTRAYPMMRGGDSVLVPVELCTDAELLGRAALLDEMAKGCREHAREIREFIKTREAAGLGTAA